MAYFHRYVNPGMAAVFLAINILRQIVQNMSYKHANLFPFTFIYSNPNVNLLFWRSSWTSSIENNSLTSHCSTVPPN